MMRIAGLVASLLLCAGTAGAQDAPANQVVIVVGKAQGAPDLNGPVRRFVEKPLKASFTVLPFPKYNQAARKAGVKPKDALMAENVRSVTSAAGAAYVVHVQPVVEMLPPPEDKPKQRPKKQIHAEVVLIDVAQDKVLFTEKYTFEKNRLGAPEGEQILAKVSSELRAAADQGAASPEVAAAGAAAETGAATEAAPPPPPEPPPVPEGPAPSADAAGTATAGTSAENASASSSEAAAADAPAEEAASAAASPETIEAAPAGESQPIQGVSAQGESEVWNGFTLRQLVGYGALGGGGLIALTGAIVVATRNDAETQAEGNTITITKRQSRAPGYTMLWTGLAVAGAGAFVLWLEPSLDLGLFSDAGATVVPTDGGAFATVQLGF